MLTKEQLEAIRARLELSQQGYMGAMINSARQDVPALLAEIERLQARLDKYKRLAEQFREDYYGAIQDTKVGEAVGSALVEQIKQKDETIAALTAKLQAVYRVEKSEA